MTQTRPPRIGLVLGAGGITGFAYHSGVLSAIGRLTGWDARTAEVIVGTSAGSGFGAMLRGGVPVDEVLAHLLSAPSNPQTMARLRVLSGREGGGPSWLWFGPGSPRLLLRELSRPWRMRPGRVAVALAPNGRIPTEFVGDRARELHGLDWPEATYWACAVRLGDGRRVVFGRGGSAAGNETQTEAEPGNKTEADAADRVEAEDVDRIEVDVGTAVEASSAIPGFFQPVGIHGHRYVDGAVNSPTNAELVSAMDLDLVVVVSPMSGTCRSSIRSLDLPSRLRSGEHLRREVKALRRAGRAVLVIEPGAEEIRTMGPLYMDPTRMVPTVLQSTAATLSRLAGDEFADALAILGRAADQTVTLPSVPYPAEATGRIS